MRTPHDSSGSNRFRPVNVGHGHIDLFETPYAVPVSLVRSSETAAPVGRYVVDMSPVPGFLASEEYFVCDSLQEIPLVSCDAIQPNETFGVSAAPLSGHPQQLGLTTARDRSGDEGKPPALQADPHEPLVGSVTIAPPPELRRPPSAVLSRRDDPQRDAFIEVWGRLPPQLRKRSCDFVGPEWAPKLVSRLGDLLTQYESGFFKSTSNL